MRLLPTVLVIDIKVRALISVTEVPDRSRQACRNMEKWRDIYITYILIILMLSDVNLQMDEK